MMFVKDPPLAVLFAKAHREPEFQIRRFTVLNMTAMSDGGSERHIIAGSDLDLLKFEPDWLRLARVELLPSRHVRVDPTRLEWRRHIEHPNVGIMIVSNSVKVFVAHSFCPTVDKVAQLFIVACQIHPLSPILSVNMLLGFAFEVRESPQITHAGSSEE